MKLFTTIASLLLMSTALQAQDIKALEAKAAANEEFLAAPAIALLDSTGVEVNENGSGSFIIRKIIKIQDLKAELSNRVIKYDYDPLTAFAKFQNVTIYKADGQVIELDVKQAVDYAAPARAIYWGARQIMIEVGRLEVGDIIDYTIDKKGFTYALLASDGSFGTTGGGAAISSLAMAAGNSDEDRFIPPMRGQYYDIVPFWVTEPTLKKVYSVTLPSTKPLQYKFYQGECAVEVLNLESSNQYEFTKSNVMPFKMEKNMVDRFDVAPKLMLSTTANWFEKSKWFYNVNEQYGSFDAYAPAQKKVDELTKDCKTSMEKISVLTHWVADNMRYSGISMGEGEGYTLHNTEMNFTDRCGVCKDKAALLISMLRMAGLEAYPAMTMAGSRIESIPADHFNHCVAVVKDDSGVYIPLDPTWVPFNRELWSSAEQQQNYLPGVPESSDLCLTPLSPAENHYLKLNSKATLREDGTLVGTITVKAEGQTDASVRRPFTTGRRSERAKAMLQELQNISPEAKLLSVDYGKNPADYQAAPIEITFKYEIPNYAILGDDEMLFLPVTMSNFYSGVRSYLRVDTSLESREYGFKDACSRLVVLDEEITLPKGYSLISSELSKTSDSKAAEFSGELKEEGGKITISQTLSLNKRVYEAEDWSGFKEAVESHKMFDNELVIKK